MSTPPPSAAPAAALSPDWLRAQILPLLSHPGRTPGDDDDLIKAGLDSLQVMRLVASLGQAGVAVTFSALIERPTLADWEDLVLAAAPNEAAAALDATRDRLSHRRLAVETGEVAGLELSLLPDGATRIHFDVDLLVADVHRRSLPVRRAGRRHRGGDLGRHAGPAARRARRRFLPAWRRQPARPPDRRTAVPRGNHPQTGTAASAVHQPDPGRVRRQPGSAPARSHRRPAPDRGGGGSGGDVRDGRDLTPGRLFVSVLPPGAAGWRESPEPPRHPLLETALMSVKRDEV